MNHGLVISLVLLELVMLEKSWGFFFLFVKSRVWKNLGAADVTFSELLGPQHSSSTLDCQI